MSGSGLKSFECVICAGHMLTSGYFDPTASNSSSVEWANYPCLLKSWFHWAHVQEKAPEAEAKILELAEKSKNLAESLEQSKAELLVTKTKLASAESVADETTSQVTKTASELQDMRKLFGQLSEKMSSLVWRLKYR